MEGDGLTSALPPAWLPPRRLPTSPASKSERLPFSFPVTAVDRDCSRQGHRITNVDAAMSGADEELGKQWCQRPKPAGPVVDGENQCGAQAVGRAVAVGGEHTYEEI